MLKKTGLILIVILLLCCTSALAGAYRPLSNGNNGDDVKKLKQRLYELGYYKSSNLDDKFTEDTANKIRQFEADCGFEETGTATPALQQLIFSDNAYSRKKGGTLNQQPATLPTVETNGYRDFYAKCFGDDVLACKQMLFKWHFFTEKASKNTLNDYSLAVFKQYQAYLGNEGDGYLTAQEQEQLFTLPNPASIPQGPSGVIELPEMNENHFLADEKAEPFRYSDR